MSGSYDLFPVLSMDPNVGLREIALYYPPGFSENPRPVYDTIYMIDFAKQVAAYTQLYLDEAFTSVAQDAVVIGHGDWDLTEADDRINLLTSV